jgi:hypothetical protein
MSLEQIADNTCIRKLCRTLLILSTVLAIRSLNIYALAWVEHNLEEHNRERFCRDYEPKNQYIRSLLKNKCGLVL